MFTCPRQTRTDHTPDCDIVMTQISETVTDGHINAAARSLSQTRTDLAARQAEVDALGSANHNDHKTGFFSMFASSPNASSEEAND